MTEQVNGTACKAVKWSVRYRHGPRMNHGVAAIGAVHCLENSWGVKALGGSTPSGSAG